MDYEYYYNNAKSKYYNACNEYCYCENRINELSLQKWQKINQINDVQKEIKNHQESLEDIEQIIRQEENLEQKISKITNATTQASANYISMVSASDVKNKDLCDVFSEEIVNTKNVKNCIFEKLRQKKGILCSRIVELSNLLSKAQTELQEIDSAIITTEENKKSWGKIKTNASIDMTYYKKKMEEE